MKVLDYIRFSFRSKLIVFFIVLLTISVFVIGSTGYLISRDALEEKGKTILKNSVLMAMDIISREYDRVKYGYSDRETAQETVKNILLGPMNSDGTRTQLSRIDLGIHGYFIIYDSKGNEVMHPLLEGKNVLNVRDLNNRKRYLVQEQIELAMNGGGYMYYSWYSPDSNVSEEKISFGKYFPQWDWIVVAASYKSDFDSSANYILFITFTMVLIVTVIISAIIIFYVKTVTRPITDVVNGMGCVAEGNLSEIKASSSHDEVELLIDGYNNMIASLRSAGEDIEKKNSYISYLAFHDEMTSLLNTNGLKSLVNGRIKDGCSQAYLLLFDIYGLKIINSTLGYEQGDHILKLIGSYFHQISSDSFHVGRTSSNEFAIWLEDSDAEDVSEKINLHKETARKHLERHGYNQIVDMHKVMVEFPLNGSDFDVLYEKGMIAMKLSKERNDLSLLVYRDYMKLSVENEVRMQRHLKTAIDRKEFVAVYQEQVDHVTGRVVGVEALARWNSQELGVIPPGIFIPAMSQLNLMTEFSEYMMKTVFGEYPKLVKKYHDDIRVSINISPSFFVDRNFYEITEKAVKGYNIPPGNVTIEITEDVFITDFDGVSSTISRLHEFGVRIAIDDFGTGYSSLNYLTNIKFDEMKIDKIFIDKIIDDPGAFRLFQILCDIADIYGYDIVAEGVETEDQLEKIRETSLRIIQGYYYSKPEPLG